MTTLASAGSLAITHRNQLLSWKSPACAAVTCSQPKAGKAYIAHPLAPTSWRRSSTADLSRNYPHRCSITCSRCQRNAPSKRERKVTPLVLPPTYSTDGSGGRHEARWPLSYNSNFRMGLRQYHITRCIWFHATGSDIFIVLLSERLHHLVVYFLNFD